ncbi:very short patch repair endonuclease [Pseudaeromonas sharmana]|uniref:Very short patch repair endonuclease n=1 Tax=Pseudaeromonas sharmana TaxID=328412 RepID=A0ABV8CLD0_9GAMM
MNDIVDRPTRSRMMSGIRNKNTKPEIMVRSWLHKHGFRFKINVRELRGKPDVVCPRYHAVIFVHGCFWHGHECCLFKWPKTRPDFWHEKITQNKARDQRVIDSLLSAGWRVGIVWECALRNSEVDMETILMPLAEWLRSDITTFEVKK